MSVVGNYFSDDPDDQPFDDVELHDWSKEELQVLSPRRKILLEMEKLLEVKLPATRKIHKGRDWKKGSPNISNEDLFELAKGICTALDEPPEVAQSIKPDIFNPTPGEKKVYDVMDEEDRFYSIREIAEETGLSESTVRDHLSSLKRKLSFQERNEGVEGGGYRKMFKLPPKFRS